jgi:hypothetical protein
MDQNTAEGVANLGVERFENGAEVGVPVAHIRGRFKSSRAAATDA